jgi:hypothetical protein
LVFGAGAGRAAVVVGLGSRQVEWFAGFAFAAFVAHAAAAGFTRSSRSASNSSAVIALPMSPSHFVTNSACGRSDGT